MKRIPTLCAAVLSVAALSAQQAVLYTGSDWSDAEASLRAVWADSTFAKAIGVTLETIDTPEHVDDAVKARMNEQKHFRLDPRNLPAFAWFDAKGRCVLLREGVEAADATAARKTLEALAAEGRAREKIVSDLLATGTAEAAGEALTLVTPELGAKRAREAQGLKDAWELLKTQDPKNATGWAFALTFDPSSDACYKVQDFVKKGDIAGAEAYVQELESKPQAHLSANQRQGLKFLRYIIYRNDPAKETEMSALLREILALDAGTHFGFAAQGLLCLRGEGPVAVPYGWFPGHVPTAGARTWEVTVGVSKTLRAPGRYALTLSREKESQGLMRVETLEIDGKTFGPIEIAPGGKAEIPFEWSGKGTPKLILRVDFEAPGAKERGHLTLRPLLPARDIRPDAPLEADATPWRNTGANMLTAVYANNVIPEKTFREVVGRPGGALFLRAFFGDAAWMEAFFGSGDPAKDWATSLRALDAMVYHRPDVLASPRLRIVATAAALNATGDPTEPVRLLGTMLELRARKRLDRSFDTLRCDQLRLTMIDRESDNADNTLWLNGRHHSPPRQYTGTCWTMPYRMSNFFGDSIHGRDYYPAWDHAYIRQEAGIKVGGVCGALSTYGSAAAKANGVPSITGGQPGHCAYVVWVASEGRWMIGNNVGPYTGSHFNIWKDAHRFSYFDLHAAAYAHSGMIKSMRLLWKAENALASQSPDRRKTYSPKQAKRFLAATRACPPNLLAWRAYANWLKGCDVVPQTVWEAFAKAAAKGLNGHLEPAWEFLCATALPEIRKAGGQKALLRTLIALHGILRQGDWKTSEFCDYNRLLNEQAKLLGDDPQACFALFAADLPTQFGTADAFGRLMRWGGARFLGNATLAPRYVAALEDLLKRRGNDGNALGRYVREAIREASQADNAEAFRALCALQDVLEPPQGRTAMDFSFAKMPLLSDRGLLRLSATSRWDHPEAYGHVIDGLTPTASFHTSEEKEPWAEVALAGMAEVAAVYIGNRPGNAGRLVPFVVEVSEDGKAWREVARDTQVRDDYRITFAPVKAQRVRVRCQPAEKTYLHLRKLCIFGRRLY